MRVIGTIVWAMIGAILFGLLGGLVGFFMGARYEDTNPSKWTDMTFWGFEIGFVIGGTVVGWLGYRFSGRSSRP